MTIRWNSLSGLITFNTSDFKYWQTSTDPIFSNFPALASQSNGILVPGVTMGRG